MWHEIHQKHRTALLFLLDRHETARLHNFIRECKIEAQTNEYSQLDVRFIANPIAYKENAPFFSNMRKILYAILKEDLELPIYSTSIKGEWNQLREEGIKIVATPTEWQEINEKQKVLLNQAQIAGEPDSYRNIGNTARHLLKALADIVFDPAKHTPLENDRDLGPDSFKNRLWAFVLFKLSKTSTYKEVRDYTTSLLNTADKAIDLSNNVTHALNADIFLGQSCAVSTIATVHFIKLVYDLPDPA